jgi:hypothetical protein
MKISVDIQTEGQYCSLECPYFSLQTGASYEKPFIETCSIFKKDLEESGGQVMRCPECMEGALKFHDEAARLAMEDACMGKEAAIRLLRDIKYAVNIYEYDTPRDLLNTLVDLRLVTREYLKRLLCITDEHLDQLMSGVEYPYLLAPLRERIGFPRPKPMLGEEVLHQRAMLIRRSEKVG